MRVYCALVEFCECSFRLLLCLVVVALCWLGDSRVYGQLLVSRGKELNCASDGNQGASIASDFLCSLADASNAGCGRRCDEHH